MADRIDAVAFPVKGASRPAARNARRAEPESEQLSVREHSVLPRGRGGEPGVERGVEPGVERGVEPGVELRVTAASPRVILRA